MKKSLWIAVAAMAVGFGMSAHATTNATYGSWSFEGIANGTLVPASGMTETDYGSWNASVGDEYSYVTNGERTNVVFNGFITNNFDGSVLNNKRIVTQFDLKPGQLEDLALLNNLDSGARLAFYFNTASNFVLLHDIGTGAWETSTVSTVAYAANTWLTIKIEQDGSAQSDNLKDMFRVFIDNSEITHADGFTRSGSTFTSGGGTWFEMHGSASSGMTALVGMGVGMMDNVSNAEFIPNWKVYMNQVWPLNSYTDPAVAAATDTDLDGENDLDEAFAGTNPQSSSSLLKIDSIAVSGGTVSVQFEGKADGQNPGTYQLMEADVVSGSYSNVDTEAKSLGTKTMTSTPAAQPKFYKILLPYTVD